MKVRLAALTIIFAAAQICSAATNTASLKGTYTFLFSAADLYQVETTNTNVLCPNTGKVTCQPVFGMDMISGTFVADGLGHITSLTFTQSAPPIVGKNSSGTGKGTYTVQSNGIGAMSLTITPTGKTGQVIGFALALGPNAAGQVVRVQTTPTNGNNNAVDGVAIRQ